MYVKVPEKGVALVAANPVKNGGSDSFFKIAGRQGREQHEVTSQNTKSFITT
jgi:hypothetical protein